MEHEYHTMKDYYHLLDEHQLIEDCDLKPDNLNRNVRYISFNSNDVVEDTLFICKGIHFSETYLRSTQSRGVRFAI